MNEIDESENIEEDEELNERTAIASSRQSKLASQVNFVRSSNLPPVSGSYGMPLYKVGDMQS